MEINLGKHMINVASYVPADKTKHRSSTVSIAKEC